MATTLNSFSYTSGVFLFISILLTANNLTYLRCQIGQQCNLELCPSMYSYEIHSSVVTLDVLVQFNITYKASETNVWSLHLKDMLVSYCMMGWISTMMVPEASTYVRFFALTQDEQNNKVKDGFQSLFTTRRRVIDLFYIFSRKKELLYVKSL